MEASALDINLLKKINKEALIDVLNSVHGSKTLVLDPSLAGPLGLITEVSLLKQHGVDKMFWLEPGPLASSTTNIVYLCRPKVNYVKTIADHIKRHAKQSLNHNYTLVLVPRLSSLISRLLEEEGVLGDINITAYNLQFLPVAEDVFRWRMSLLSKIYGMDGDESVVYDSAQALITIQKLFGSFPRLLGKGDHAATYLPQARTPETPSSNFDSLIVIDRRVDMITPLLTQLTYEGLIDELLGIKNSHVELPASLVSPPDATETFPSTLCVAEKRDEEEISLSSSDALSWN
ncbi:Sec1-like protein [Gymnopus androsaceus JB14]|uniref:Sec1-like protein n=1 Tax=Gymnopus androsaceus JB14 TaxID=1447944 RepID=A0A6A4H5F8_9AGAR|nr:Sec1-like protein [Gymnopus androsaceus JB14]